jgi:hypothetical protein
MCGDAQSHECTEHVESSMGQIDHAHDAKDQRQPAGYEEEYGCIRDSVQKVGQNQFQGFPFKAGQAKTLPRFNCYQVLRFLQELFGHVKCDLLVRIEYLPVYSIG